MQTTVMFILLTALFAAFIILLSTKTGIRDKVRDWLDRKQTKWAKVIASAIDCDFCLSFWVCVILVVCALLAGLSVAYITPFCAAPITRFLL